MIKNNIIIAYRNLIRKKGYSLINVSGLAIGIASSIMIILFVSDELSYDRYHENASRIYRVCMKARMQGTDFHAPVTPAPMAGTLVADYPEVLSAVRLYGFDASPIIRNGDRKFVESSFVYADSSLFDVFTFKMVNGDPSNALTRPNTVVLSETAAMKYFGDQDPMGQILELGSQRIVFEVTGVIEDVNPRSHFSFDVIASFVSTNQHQSQVWVSNNYYTYILLERNSNPADINARLPEMLKTYLGPQVELVMGTSLEEFYESGEEWGYYLQPLTSIHLHSDLQYEIEANGSINTVIVFSIIALFILVIASINFMNLSTARSAGRAREIGLKKVVGSGKRELLYQFLGESVFMSFISLLLALVLVELFIPSFNSLTGKELEMRYFAYWYTIPVIILGGVMVGIISGSYPAFYLASFNPLEVLKGKLRSGMKSRRLRGILVTFQFVTTIILFTSTLTVYRQIDFINSKEKGLDPDNVMVIKRAYSIPADWRESFCLEICGYSGVKYASRASAIPGKPFSGNAFRPEGSASREQYIVSNTWVDWDYADVLGLEMVEGRFFSREYASDSLAVVLNEAAVRQMGYTDPVGKRVLQTGGGGSPEAPIDLAYTIIGVVRDFHFESLHQTINPMILSYGQNGQYIIAKLEKGNPHYEIDYVREKWNEFVDDQPFAYSFLLDDLVSDYRSEQRMGLVFSIFAALSIFIACLGLLGLASFTAEQRSKEIGIRKAMGASAGSVMMLLSKEINLLVFISTLIAWPVAWYFMKNWLDNYAYRVDMGITVFFVSSGLTYLIALATVSFQAHRAASVNPVESLREE